MTAVDIRPALTLAAFGLVFLGLIGLTVGVALMDIRRELRRLRHDVRRSAFVRPPNAGNPGCIDRCPDPSPKEHQP